MRKLDSCSNSQNKQPNKNFQGGREISLEQVHLALFTAVEFNEAIIFDGACNQENEDHRELWEIQIIRKDLKIVKKTFMALTRKQPHVISQKKIQSLG
jgi:hypothetical protein